MEFKYIATNADNAGDGIGNAIASDNHEELSKLTSSIDAGQAGITEWVQSVGGEIITSSGDEIIAKIPVESYDEASIESLRGEYSLSAGTTITIGIGDSMSEASKALIYGKMNEKDQVVEYDPHIDDYISDYDEEIPEEIHEEDTQEVPEEEVPEHEQHLDEEGKAIHDSTEMETDEEELREESMAEVGEQAVADESQEYTDQEAMGDERYEDESEYERMGASQEEEMPEYQEEVSEYDGTAVRGESTQEETDETLLDEGNVSEEDMGMNPEDKLEDVVGEDLDGDGDIDAMPVSDDPMGEEEMPMGEEEMPVEGEEGSERQSALTDMIHANMGEEESEEEGGSDEELRQDIATSLMTFKENKPMLEQARSENPKLYEATILMLRSMIEMAKKLNMNPEADVEGQEVQDALPDAEMDQMDQMEEGDEQMVAQEEEAEEAEGLEEVEDEAEDDKRQKEDKIPFGKNEQTAHDLAAIFHKKLKKALGQDKEKTSEKKN